MTVAINTVVNGLDWISGDEVLASNQEYGAIDNCLHNATQRWGVTIRRAEIPIPPQTPDQIVDAFRIALTPRTRLLFCSHITTHTGLITEVHDGYFITIEGNTNDEGSREGYEVCQRRRDYNRQNLDVFSLGV